MKACLQCGKTYPDEFQFCPVHGTPLGVVVEKEGKLAAPPPAPHDKTAGNPSRPSRPAPPPATVRVRTVVSGLLILVLLAFLSFACAFLYNYWKPKYGALTVTTTPEEALVYVDGKRRGPSPLNIPKLRSGAHEVKIVKAGYKDFSRRVMVSPYADNDLHWDLEPVVPQLSAKQLVEIQALHEKLASAQKENILLPPPDDYNVLYFVNQILAIDPADAVALETRAQLADSTRRLAELAYARENWLESEKQYKQLALVTPEDGSVGERLADLAEKIDASVKDREKQVQDWRARAEAAMKVGSLTPPDKDNALDAIRNIQRLDKGNAWARDALKRLRELLQNRGDARMSASDWTGARADFRQLLQYFPGDAYGKTRLAAVEAKLEEAAKQERSAKTEQQSRQQVAALRQTALDLFAGGEYAKSVAAWREYLKFDPKSDEAWFYIGAGYQNQKQFDAAITNFEKCLELNPNNILAHLNIGLLYDYHRKNYKAAEEHLRKVKELGGADRFTPEQLDAMIRDLQTRARNQEIAKLAIPVEHKHTFSSCRGTLHFSEDGMEFRTDASDHSFYEAWKGMKGFALGEETLSIKTLRDKKYNFRFLNPQDAARIRAWAATVSAIPTGGDVR